MAVMNLIRRRRSSLLVILMIGLSLALMLGLIGLYEGMMKNATKALLDSDMGEVSIYAKEYRLYESLDYRIKDAKAIEEKLKAYEGVGQVVSRVVQRGLVSTARRSKQAYLIGIDLEAEERFGELLKMMKEGSAQWGKRELGCVMGYKLAKDMKLKVGTRVIYSSQSISGEIESIALRVKGIIKRDNPAIDERVIYVSKGTSIEFSKIEAQSRTQIALRIDDPVKVESVREKIQSDYPHLDVKNYKELIPMIVQQQEMMDVFNAITFLIVMFVVFIGIFGVMYVSVLERLREFGILMAVGTTYAKLRFQIIMEVLILSFIGYLLGSLLGWMLLKYWEVWGMDLSDFADAMQEFGLAAVMHATIKLSYFTTTFWGIVIAAMVSIIIPLRRLKKLKPIEVIQGD